jgi:hypothetical protein
MPDLENANVLNLLFDSFDKLTLSHLFVTLVTINPAILP